MLITHFYKMSASYPSCGIGYGTHRRCLPARVATQTCRAFGASRRILCNLDSFHHYYLAPSATANIEGFLSRLSVLPFLPLSVGIPSPFCPRCSFSSILALRPRTSPS